MSHTSLVFIILGILALAAIGMYFNYNNKEIALRQEADASIKKVEVVHDKMWKVIQQKAQVSDEYRASFDSIYTHIIAGRYSQGDGSLMKWITEANPEFDASLYKDLMQSIEICRTEFQHAQERVVDIIREHKVLCQKYPSRWFISNTTEIDYTVISSSKTQEVMTTGVDNDVDVFKR